MSSTLDARPEVARYLAAVRGALGDLPASEREDLLAEVESSLLETADESGNVNARLGPPDEFAAELRAAAGLAPVAKRSRRRLRERLASLRSPAFHTRVRELTPIWWVARGYVAVAFIGVAGAGWAVRHATIPSIGDGRRGALCVAGAILASLLLGLRLRTPGRRARVALIAGNSVLALMAIPVFAHVIHATTTTRYVTVEVNAQPPTGLLENGAPVTNIYAFTTSGKMLHDVLLYDGFGRPLNLGAGTGDPNRRYLHTRGRYAPILNSFPIRYYEPGTTRVTHPDAIPPIRIPRLVPTP